MGHKERLLKYFKFKEPSHRPNTGSSDAGDLPLELQLGIEVPLAHLTLKHINKDDRILLTAAIGWQALPSGGVIDTTEVSFKIRHHEPDGIIVFETIDTGDNDTFRYTTSFLHAESNISDHHKKYFLTATLLTPDHPVAIIGPISFTGSVIDENET